MHHAVAAILFANLLTLGNAWAQSVDATWVSASLMPPVVEQVDVGAPTQTAAPMNLDLLSDQELIDLYAAAYRQSLRTQVVDDTALVEPGRFLLQCGYTFSAQSQNGLRHATHTIPELMLRYRLFPRLEVRVAWAGVTFDRLTDEVSGANDWETRLSDPSVGVRLALTRQRGWRPRTSLTVSSPLNVDSNAALVNRLDPFVGLGYSWLLAERWLVSGSSAMVWTRENNDRYLDFQQTLAVDWLATERWAFSFEWSSLFPEGARVEGMSHTLGPGVSLGLTRDLQLDMLVLFGVDDASPDVLTQLFLSWRF